MGDRTFSYYDCPKCKTKNGVEIYDAPSCMLYVEGCCFCDYNVDLDYYYGKDENHLELLSMEQAEKKGYFCLICGITLYLGEERKTKICEKCEEKKRYGQLKHF